MWYRSEKSKNRNENMTFTRTTTMRIATVATGKRGKDVENDLEME